MGPAGSKYLLLLAILSVGAPGGPGSLGAPDAAQDSAGTCSGPTSLRMKADVPSLACGSLPGPLPPTTAVTRGSPEPFVQHVRCVPASGPLHSLSLCPQCPSPRHPPGSLASLTERLVARPFPIPDFKTANISRFPNLSSALYFPPCVYCLLAHSMVLSPNRKEVRRNRDSCFVP